MSLLELGSRSATIRLPARSGEALRQEAAGLLQAVDTCSGRSDKCSVVFLRIDGEAQTEADVVSQISRTNSEAAAPSSASSGSDLLDELFHGICQLPQLVVGLVSSRVGAAGLCLIAACDVVIAARSSEFALVERANVPAFLLRHLGAQFVQKLLACGDRLDVDQAQDFGLVSEIVDSPISLQSRYDGLIDNLSQKNATTPASLRSLLRGTVASRNVCSPHGASERLRCSNGSSGRAKRSGGFSLGGPQKRRNIMDDGEHSLGKPAADSPCGEICHAIQIALEGLQEIEPTARGALTNLVVDSLENQETSSSKIRMSATIQEALARTELRLEEQIREGQSLVNGADAERSMRSAADASAQANLTAIREAVAEKKQTLLSSTASLEQASRAVLDAEIEESTGNVDLDVAVTAKAQLEDAQTSMYIPLKLGSLSGARAQKQVATLVAVCRKHDFEETLLVGLPEALPKKASARNTFDQMILKTLESTLAIRISELDFKLSEGAPGRDRRAAAVQTARGAVDAFLKRQQEGTAALREASAQLRDVEAAAKVTSQAAHEFNYQIKQAHSDLEVATRQLAAFRVGPLAAFKLLTANCTENADVTPALCTAGAEAVPDETGEPCSTEGCGQVGNAHDGAEASESTMEEGSRENEGQQDNFIASVGAGSSQGSTYADTAAITEAESGGLERPAPCDDADV